MTLAIAPRPVAGVQTVPVDKPFLIELPDAERGRDERDLARLDVLNARLSKPPKPRGRISADEARAQDLAERDELENRPHVQAERVWAKAANDETARLAHIRGEAATTNSSGRLEIISRDPLRRLLNSGKLTVEQHEAGEALRECYEARSGDANSQLAELVQSGSAHDNHRFVATRYTRALATDRAQAVEIAVLTGYYRLRDGTRLQIKAHASFGRPALNPATGRVELPPPPHIALTVLRDLCAHNVGLTDQGRGRAFERNSKALLIALDIARECLMGSRTPRD
jgi:hypothetical protein